jgi:hypothetical protein
MMKMQKIQAWKTRVRMVVQQGVVGVLEVLGFPHV